MLFVRCLACLLPKAFNSSLRSTPKSTLFLFPAKTCFDIVVANVIAFMSVPIVRWLLQRHEKQLASDLLPLTLD